MTKRTDRRDFLKTTAALAAGASLTGWTRGLAAAECACQTPNCVKLGWELSACQYTFRRFPLYDALGMIAGLGLKAVETGFFLPLDKARPQLKCCEDLSAEVRAELKQKLAGCGLQMSSYYSNLGTDAAAARKTFEYAKEMGVKTLVAEPPAEAFEMLDGLCNEFGINLAVHNHPKHDNYTYWNYTYWQPEGVLKVCEGRSKRVGACVDTGHWVRSGLKPVECLKKMEGRIISTHLKDVGEWGKPEARDVPLGTGLADYAGVLKELHRQGVKGVFGIEYEHDSEQLVQDVAACIAFVEKTAATLA